jgi:branched-chain amino acid transport system permease protein
MTRSISLILILIAALILPHFLSNYVMHIVILIMIWGYISTAWAYMGRFGLVSLGHGAFLGLGAYTSALLLNSLHVTPIVGMFIGGLAAVVLALIIGYGCFRFGIIGDYFALVTLALAEIIMLLVIAFRDFTGGSLGMTIDPNIKSLFYLTSNNKIFFYYLSLGFLILAIVIWKAMNNTRLYKAMKAIGEDEDAAAAIGINVIKYKLVIISISAFFTALGGTIYGQYITYLNPHNLSGVSVSLNICFYAILGGMFNMMGPIIGAGLIVFMEEIFRGLFGAHFIGGSEILYGIAIITLIIFLPKGLFGTLADQISNIKKRREVKK